MNKDYFHIAIVTSLLLHLVISMVVNIPYPKANTHIKKDPKTEFVELEDKKELKKLIKLPKIPPPYINIKNKLPTLKKVAKPKASSEQKKKQNTTVEDVKEGFTEDEVKEKKVESTPEYLNYYDMIREKIRKNAFNFYRSRESGRIIIDFVLDRKGNLVDVSVKTEGSSNSHYLKEIALKSVYKSLPFSKFPEELSSHSNLPFNVSIFFRTK